MWLIFNISFKMRLEYVSSM